MKNAVEEMVQNGIVAIGDICNNSLAISVKNDKRLQYFNFIEVSGWNPAVASQRLSNSKFLYVAYLRCEKKTSIVPHAAYSVAYPLWENITPYYSGQIVTIHNQETTL